MYNDQSLCQLLTPNLHNSMNKSLTSRLMANITSISPQTPRLSKHNFRSWANKSPISAPETGPQIWTSPPTPQKDQMARICELSDCNNWTQQPTDHFCETHECQTIGCWEELTDYTSQSCPFHKCPACGKAKVGMNDASPHCRLHKCVFERYSCQCLHKATTTGRHLR